MMRVDSAWQPVLLSEQQGGSSARSHPLLASLEQRSWTVYGVCGALGHLFFEPFGERPGTRARRETKAKAVCEECPVMLVCREAGRRNFESGIWGGETEEDRAVAGFAPRSMSRRSVAKARREAL